MPKRITRPSQIDETSVPLANGSGTSTTSYQPTGNDLVDAIMKGMKWSGGRISYSFPDSPSDYGRGYADYYARSGFLDDNGNGKDALHDGFAELGILQKQAVHLIFDADLRTRPSAAGFAVEGFTNLQIDFAGSGNGNGTIRIARTADTARADITKTGAAAYVIPLGSGGPGEGDAFMGSQVDLLAGSASRSYFFFLHELGHSLGLKHAHEQDWPWPSLDYEHDSSEYTVMTYRTYKGAPSDKTTLEDGSSPQSFMMLDIAALQQMYGANYKVNSGDTVYRWDPASGSTWVNNGVGINSPLSAIFATIWDGGGNDTYNLSAYANDLKIDLRPGEWSTFSKAQLANLGKVQAIGNIANALLFENNPASLIENAIGGAAADRITGNQAGNSLTGGLGNDTLNGLQGNDTLTGGAGSDYMDGGDGNDSVSYHDHVLSITLALAGSTTAVASTGGDRDRIVNVENIYGGQAGDTFRGDGFNNVIRGRGGNDAVNGGDGIDTVDFLDKTTKVSIQLNGSTKVKATIDFFIDEVDTVWNVENIIGGQASDTLTGDIGDNRIDGHTGSDTIAGDAGDDALIGGDGSDTIHGGYGADTIEGGNGNDSIDGSFDDDRLSGGAGIDTVRGGAGNDRFIDAPDGDTLYGGDGMDVLDFRSMTAQLFVVLNGKDAGFARAGSVTSAIYGIEAVIAGSANDILTGDAGDNRLFGGAGNDLIRDGAGADTVWGQDGDDTIIAGDLNPGDDNWDGGAGTDTISFDSLTAALASVPVFNLDSGFLVLNAQFESITGFENLTGSMGADRINGSRGDNVLRGAAGDDIINGRAGDDTMYGDNGDDILSSGGGKDTLDGGNGNDTADYSANTGGLFIFFSGQRAAVLKRETEGSDTLDRVDTLVSIERVTGGSGSDTILAPDADNILQGGGGNDLLSDGGGTDRLHGGAGDDMLRTIDGIFGNDVFDGGDGADTISLEYLDVEAALGAGASVTVDLAAQTVSHDGGSDTLLSIENATGSDHADTIRGSSAGNLLAGGGGNDSIEGGAGADNIRGGDGDDVLSGGDGTDDIAGGEGNDTITDYSFDGSVDVIDGGAGDDQLFNEMLESGGSWDGGDGVDTLHLTGENMDNYTIDLGAPAFVILGTSFRGIENILTSIGDDTITGSSDANLLDGSRGSDQLRGMGGNDTVIGGEGNDVLYGNGGADAIRGGRGADVLFGGSGADIFVFELSPNGEVDSIADMTAGVDKIVLSAAAFGFASTGPLPASAFVIGAAAADASDRIIYDKASGSIFFDADGDGAGTAVQFASVALSANLSLVDFLIA